MMRHVKIVASLLLIAGLVSCSEKDEAQPQGIGAPIQFDFQFAGPGTKTRASLSNNKVVYVTTDGSKYYTYSYDDSDERWECNSSDKLLWTGNSMQLYAIARDEGGSLTMTTIEANQRDNGYDDSDFLACGGTYNYTAGKLKMTLEHKVSKLVVNVTNCYDASKMTCETVSTAIPTSGSIGLTASDVAITALASPTSGIKLNRTTYDTGNNTAEFVAYLLPQTGFDGKFKLMCGSTLTYYNSGTTVDLEAGKTTVITIALKEIQGVYEYYPVTASGGTYTVGTDLVYEGTYQTFTAPCTGKYRLEVYGAQGGTYTSASNAYKSLCYMGESQYTPFDELKKAHLNCRGGKGAYVTGVVKLDKGTPLYIYVGKQASTYLKHPVAEDAGNQTYSQYQKQADETWMEVPLTYKRIFHEMDGGWNGGGASVAATLKAVNVDKKYGVTTKTDATTTTDQNITIVGVRPQYAGGGGGASDISLKSGLWNSEDHLISRIIVAGGGGGGCYYPGEEGYYNGGIGGGGLFLGISTWNGGEADGYAGARGLGGMLGEAPTGPTGAHNVIDGNLYGTAAYNKEGETSQNETILPIIPYAWLPGFGFGGSADWSGEGLGAGGGGWYGGSAGTGANSNGGGGGGSSWAYTSNVSYNGKPLNQYHPNYGTAKYIPGEGYLLTNVQNQGGVREGDGYVKITLLAE